MKKIKTMLLSGLRLFLELRLPFKILLVLAVVGSFSFVMIKVTSTPGFCNSCHVMNPYYDSWKASSHADVDCLSCHLKPGFSSYMKGKINGMIQSIECVSGRYGTKPNAIIKDVSCLRSECHNAEVLATTKIDYKGIKFTHGKHIGREVDGIKLTCGTCHSHFEGDEHFNINSDVCFTCHFLKSEKSNGRLVQTGCKSCHEVPNKVIQRGMVAVNHSEFVSYEASCEDSCHKKQIEKESNMADSVCLSCHSFLKPDHVDSVELHEAHSGHEKVECFACHGKVSHKATESLSVAAMMDCKSCHSDTHNIQLSAYSAEQHPQDNQHDDRVLSPMFLTHVECTSCHIEQSQLKSDSIASIGMVAKASPKACDSCHEKGTGQRYIPFWQGKIRKLHKQIQGRLRAIQTKTKVMSSQDVSDRIRQAEAILESVESDGSWGVHNLKYTEAMLLKANELINQVK